MGYFDQFNSIMGKKKPPFTGSPTEPQPNVLPSVEPIARPQQPELVNPNIQRQQDVINQDLINKPAPQSPYDTAKKNYETVAAAPIEKQPLWKQVLFVGLQAVQNAATGQQQPIQFLGNAKHDYNVGQAGRIYAPLRQQHEAEMADQYKQAQTSNVYADNTRQQQELERKRTEGENKARYYDGILKDKSRGRDLNESQIEDLRTYREFLMRNATKNTEAKLKQIEETLKDHDLDREERIRHNQVTEGQGDRRVGLSEERESRIASHADAIKADAEKRGKDKALASARKGFVDAYMRRNVEVIDGFPDHLVRPVP